MALGGGALIAGFGVGIASVLGWDLLGSADNGGIGVPLSTEEARVLQSARHIEVGATRDATERASGRPRALVTLKDQDEGARPKSTEEAAEDEALIKLVFGEDIRAR